MSHSDIRILFPPSSTSIDRIRDDAMNKQQTGPIARARQTLSEFFYAQEVPYALALMRILLPIGLLLVFVKRWPYSRELYSSDGAIASLWDNLSYAELLPVPSGPVAVAMCTTLIFSLIALSFGWLTRLNCVVSLVLTTWLSLLDAVSTMTKFTCVAAHLLLLLSLSRCGAVWSVDAWLSRRRTPAGEYDAPPRAATWPRRLVQILIGVIYLSAAVTKMQSTNFFSGDQLHYWLIGDANWENPLGESLAMYPPLIVMMSIITIVWEMLFVFVCWKGPLRFAVLSIGLVFHALTYFTLGLMIFPIIYFAAYMAFLEQTECEQFAVAFHRLRKRLGLSWRLPAAPPWMSPQSATYGFGMFLCGLVIAGVQIERRNDLYGLARAEGPYTLPVISPEQVERMFVRENIRPIDKLLNFDVGTLSLAGHVGHPKREFEVDETSVIHCALAPPHDDTYVEVNVHDAHDRPIQQMGQVVAREEAHSTFVFTFPQTYATGEYDFVLLFDSSEVARKRVHLQNRLIPPVRSGLAQVALPAP